MTVTPTAAARPPGVRRRRFHVCLHDATPRYASETCTIMRDLAPLVGRRLSLGVVPNWHGAWPLASHRDYCRLLKESGGELILHGYRHHRQHGLGPLALVAGRSDEMNGLDGDATQRTIERGQRVFTETFGAPARGFLAPAWQRGHVRPGTSTGPGLHYVVGFFSLDPGAGRSVPLATSTWDCGHWGWLGHIGHGIGRVLQSRQTRVPVLAIHPRDVQRGFWPTIVRLTRTLLANGYQPSTLADLLEGDPC